VDADSATDVAGWRVRRVAETGSTNSDLVAAAREGAASKSVLVADFQTAGRGRLGRRWDAPAGSSLLVSVLVRPPAETLARLHGASQAVALAARAACRDVAGFEPDLKWPNDLLVGDRKLAGILAEAVTPPGGRVVDAVVVGMGLNVAWPPEPTDLAISAASVAGRPVDRDDILRSLLGHLSVRFEQWEREPQVLLADYERSLATLGRRVRAELPDGVVVGTAVGLSAAGHLIIDREDREEGEGGSGRVEVSAADVVHLRGSVL
jgi:BirA family biotin operon repressor/biotin-[acetyl-CoA-carboxylase] ligase